MSEDEQTSHDDEHREEFDREFKEAMAAYEAAQAAAPQPSKVLNPTFGTSSGEKSDRSQPASVTTIQEAQSISEEKNQLILNALASQLQQMYYQKFEPDLYRKLMGADKVVYPSFSPAMNDDDDKNDFISNNAFKLAQQKKLDFKQLLEKFYEKDTLFRDENSE